MQVPIYLKLPSYFPSKRFQVSERQSLMPQKPDQVQFGLKWGVKRRTLALPTPLERRLLLYAESEWEGTSVCNAAALRLSNGNTCLLYRANSKTAQYARPKEFPLTRTPIFPERPQASLRDGIVAQPVGPFVLEKPFAEIGLVFLGPNNRTVVRNLKNPVLFMPSDDMIRFPNGLEDPRVTKIGDTYYIVTAAINAGETIRTKEPVRLKMDQDIKGQYIYLITTKDFKDFDYVGQIGPDIFDKNAFFHSEPVNVDGRPHFLLFHRLKSGIQVALAPSIQTFKTPGFWDNEVNKREQRTILKPLFDWEGIGSAQYPDWPGQIAGAAAPVPFMYNAKTRKFISYDRISKAPKAERQNLRTGWLFLYNGAGPPDERKKVVDRDIGACLLTIKENVQSVDELPVSVLARTPKPILSPKTPRENNAPRGGKVVFSCGYLVSRDKKRLEVFYGSGDTAISFANFDLGKLINYLLQFGPDGDRADVMT